MKKNIRRKYLDRKVIERFYCLKLVVTSSSKVLGNCERFILTNISDSILLNCLFHFAENGLNKL